jgi:hypothetical protein
MRRANDAGVAVILALVTAVLLSALGSGLLLLADLERLSAANAGFGAEAMAAAEAGAERAIIDLRRAADWTAVRRSAPTRRDGDCSAGERSRT